MQVKEKRVSVDLHDLKILINKIKKSKNLSLRKINEVIGTNIRNFLYGTTKSIKKSSAIKLEELANERIKYIIIQNVKIPRLKKNNNLAELIGIILGDGGVYKLKYRIQISFNGFDEFKYVNYVRNLLNMLFYISPKEYWERRGKNASGKEKGMILYYNNKNIFNELTSHGVIPGNKIKNQISVPRWIKTNEEFMIACIRGLFDTDGSLHLYSKRPSLRIEFSNASLPLIKDYYDMCTSLGITPQPKIVKRKWKSVKNKLITYTYKVVITAKIQVSKFLYLIQPKKFLFHSIEIVNQLKKLGFSLKDVLFYKNGKNNSYYSKIINQLNYEDKN